MVLLSVGCEKFDCSGGGGLSGVKMLELDFCVEHLFFVVLLKTLVGNIHFRCKITEFSELYRGGFFEQVDLTGNLSGDKCTDSSGRRVDQ